MSPLAFIMTIGKYAENTRKVRENTCTLIAAPTQGRLDEKFVSYKCCFL